MDSKIAVTHTTVPGNECLIIKGYGYNPATMNAIRRAMLLYVETFGFETEMDPKDYKIITGTKEERRNTVLVSSLASQSIPVLAHRCSRLAIHTSEETAPLLTSDDERKVFFVICQPPESLTTDMKVQMTKPLTVDRLTYNIHSRDLIPVVLVKVQEEDDEEPHFEYSKEESDIIKDAIVSIFPYDELIAVVNHGQQLNVILKPVRGTGSIDARWAPCTFRYHYMMDPTWKTHGEGVCEKGQVRRKIEGQRSFCHLFTHKPPAEKSEDYSQDEPYNRFGKPWGITLVFQNNGKMEVKEAYHRAIKELVDGIYLFQKRYSESETDGNMILKEASQVSSEDGSLNSDVEILYIPKNTQDKLPEKDYVLADGTIANLITTKMLELVQEKILELNLADDIWSQTNIAYKVPHPLINQCMMMIKIPDNLGFKPDKLIDQAVKEIKRDLDRLYAAV